MKLNGFANKRWFSWIIISILVISNIVSYRMADSYFKHAERYSSEDVKVENSILGGGSRIISLAKEIMRFFRNP